MVASDEILLQKIFNFIEQNNYNNFGIFKKPLHLHRSTTLESDLGITGDDAEEFMSKFMKVFSFEMGDFDIGRYFGSEGFWPLPSFRKRGTIKKLTLGMLEQAVIDGVWSNDKLDKLC